MTETHATRIARASAYLVIERIVTIVIGAIAFAFIARTLTQMEMGVIVALALTLGVAQLFSDFGFSTGLSKYIAEYKGKSVEYTSLLFSGVLMKILTAGFIAIVCAAGAQQLSELFLKSGEYAILFQLLSVDILFAGIYSTMNSFLLGLNKIREMAILLVASSFTRQVSAVVLLVCGYGLIGLVTGWILGDLAHVILSALIIVRGKHIKKHSAKEVAQHLKMLIRFSWPLFVTFLVVFFYGWFDKAVLLTYIPLGELGVYNVASQAFGILAAIPVALTNTLFPYYSEQYGRNKHESIAVGVRAATRYITLLYTPLALGLMITANPTITLFAGLTYASGDIILAVLSLFGAVGGLSAAFGVLLVVYNMTSKVLLINIVSVGVSVALSPVLLPYMGATGMAVIKGVSMTLSLILTIIALRKSVPIKFDKDAIWKSWGAAIVMFMVVWLIEQVHFSQYLLPLYMLVGGTAYVIVLRILKAVNENDFQLMRNLTGKRLAPLIEILEKILM